MLTDQALYTAVLEMQGGLIDADLGGGIVKKRIGLAGRGKSAGIRTLVATRRSNRWFFVFGFAKNERVAISATELIALQTIASELLVLTDWEISAAIRQGILEEINNEFQS